MKSFSVTVLLLLASLAIRADWSRTNGPYGGQVNIIAPRPSSGDLFAGLGGGVARSTNDGSTWFDATDSLPPTFSVSGIAFLGSDVYVCGTSPVSGGGVYRSTNNGTTWSNAAGTGLTTGAYAVMNDIAVSNGRLLISASFLLGGASVYSSTDGGLTWTVSATGLPTGFGANRFHVTGAFVFVGSTLTSGSHGVYRSSDNGANWTVASGGFPTTSFETAFASIGSTIFAATNSAGVWRTADNGGSWTRISPTAPVLIMGASALTTSGTNLYIAGGKVWKADANGDNWQEILGGLPATNSGTFTPAIARSGSAMIVAFKKIGLYRTTTDGSSWTAANSGLRATRVFSVYASGGRIYSSTETIGFARTDDGGAAWQDINSGIDLASDNAYYGFAESGGYLLAGAGGPGVVRSNDGGDTWSATTGTSTAPAYAIVSDPGGAYIGTLGTVMKSTDDGASWTALNTGFLPYAVVYALWKNGDIMLAGSTGGGKRSTDGGVTWTAPMSGYPSIGSSSGYVKVNNTIFLAHNAGIYASTDDGATWSSRSTGIALGNPARCIVAVGTDLYVGTNQGVYMSNDLGLHWNPINEGLPPGMQVGSLTEDGLYLYAGTEYHAVWKRPLSEITAVEEYTDQIPDAPGLLQNYPNPFNPTTVISYSLPASGSVTLKVYNVVGEEVITLVDGEEEAGTHTVVWDATAGGKTAAASGVYYCRMQNEGIVTVRKLLLVR